MLLPSSTCVPDECGSPRHDLPTTGLAKHTKTPPVASSGRPARQRWCLTRNEALRVSPACKNGVRQRVEPWSIWRPHPTLRRPSLPPTEPSLRRALTRSGDLEGAAQSSRTDRHLQLCGPPAAAGQPAARSLSIGPVQRPRRAPPSSGEPTSTTLNLAMSAAERRGGRFPTAPHRA